MSWQSTIWKSDLFFNQAKRIQENVSMFMFKLLTVESILNTLGKNQFSLFLLFLFFTEISLEATHCSLRRKSISSDDILIIIDTTTVYNKKNLRELIKNFSCAISLNLFDGKYLHKISFFSLNFLFHLMQP